MIICQHVVDYQPSIAGFFIDSEVFADHDSNAVISGRHYICVHTREPLLFAIRASVNNPPDLLYLGFTFPPGVAALHPAVNSFSHAHHARMVHELERDLHVHSVNLLPFLAESPPHADPASGLDSQLTLTEGKPELFHQLQSIWRLRRFYQNTYTQTGYPKAVFVYNLTPVYNHFVRWLSAQPNRPKIILHLEDSPQLGGRVRGFKRFRYRLKPLYYADDDMLRFFDGCVGLSQSAESHFQRRGIPYLWLPGASDPFEIDPSAHEFDSPSSSAPIRFGYFGSLSPYAGVQILTESFMASQSTGTLDICGYGKQADELARVVQSDSRIRFRGLLKTPADCLRFGAECDVLVNPRPASHGNENNFPSKAFQYASCGRAILTTRLGGVESVFGNSAYHLETANLADSLKSELERLAEVPRPEHRKRGQALRQRVIDEYTYERWGEKVSAFIRSLI